MSNFSDYIVTITKGKILINDMECTIDNYEQVFKDLGIGDHEAKEIISLIFTFIRKKRRIE